VFLRELFSQEAEMDKGGRGRPHKGDFTRFCALRKEKTRRAQGGGKPWRGNGRKKSGCFKEGSSTAPSRIRTKRLESPLAKKMLHCRNPEGTLRTSCERKV